MSYGQYLGLDQILTAQHPQTDRHDELLFVIIHQTKELWLKQILHEVGLAQSLVRTGELVPAYKSLARVSRIQAVMTMSWDVLSTMTPSDYSSFRDGLGSSSGFQSVQFRELEYRLGLKNEGYMAFHQETPDALAHLRAAFEAPSLYDDAIHQLAKAGFEIPQEVLNRDTSTPWVANAAVEAAWVKVYQDTKTHWELYQLAEKLVDLEDALVTWRHKHLLTVERIIGRKMGTGGTDGIGYLTSTLKKRCFPELWSIRTQL